MRFLFHLVILVIVNALGLWAAATFIPGFHLLVANLMGLLELAAVFTVLNLLVKPVVKLILGPVIVLTLGLGLIVVNALMLEILDILTKQLTIETIPALVYATLLIGAINFIFHFATKSS